MNGKLKKLREERGLTQKKLAENLGISRFHISKIENGTNQPSLALLERIAAHFEVSVKDLF
jgi:DNA-binding XRE family transcriptional regulator